MALKDYQTWWHEEGSALRPFDGEDLEKFARRISETAWLNGEYVAKRDAE